MKVRVVKSFNGGDTVMERQFPSHLSEIGCALWLAGPSTPLNELAKTLARHGWVAAGLGDKSYSRGPVRVDLWAGPDLPLSGFSDSDTATIAARVIVVLSADTRNPSYTRQFLEIGRRTKIPTIIVDLSGSNSKTYQLRVVKDEFTLARQIDAEAIGNMAKPLLDTLGALRALGSAKTIIGVGKSAWKLVDATKGLGPTVEYVRNFGDTKGWPITGSDGRGYSAEIDTEATHYFLINKLDTLVQGPESFGGAARTVATQGLRPLSFHVTFQLTRWYVWYNACMKSEQHRIFNELKGDASRYHNYLSIMEVKEKYLRPGMVSDYTAPALWNESIARFSRPGTVVKPYEMDVFSNPLELMPLAQILEQ